MPSRRPAAAVEQPTRYTARHGAIVGHNLGGFFNRPLYVANTDAFVLAGDRPVIRFGSEKTLHGTFGLGVVRGGRSGWLHDFSDLTFEYRPNHATWLIRDSGWAGLELKLEVVGQGDAVGFAARLTVAKARPGDRLVWWFGGAKIWPEGVANWDFDPHRRPLMVPEPLPAELCAGNRVTATGGVFSVAPGVEKAAVVVGRCDAGDAPRVGDGTGLANPAKLRTASAGAQPLAVAEADLAGGTVLHWHFLRLISPHAARPRSGSVAAAFSAGRERGARLEAQLVVETPEPRLNALAAALAAALDGAWYGESFRHGAMLWNVRYPGWRTLCGGTAVGWHDRVKTEADFYTGHQVTESKLTSFAAEPATLLTVPAKDSRFYGRGRILQDQGLYNMQSQFFDQLIHAWRWTGDAALEAKLRPALELHLEWLQECFDPDDDALYESYINVWPTDSVWYAGGGATEETAYAYRAHATAAELARRAGDAAGARRHARRAARIRSAFWRRLWITERGHPALYREQHGSQRRHDDAWLYSIFLPIDAGLLDPRRAAEALRYTEAGLQNDRMPEGGRMVWASNFVPAIWSVRERWPGDNHHLALAYFQAGLGEDGWDIFRGSFLHTAFSSAVPGDLGAPAGGTDFGDSTHMFARTLVEGLFGFVPDRPRGVVRIFPQFPADWDHARLQSPDVQLRYARSGAELSLEVELPEPAKLEITLPVCARGIGALTVDGRPARWKAEPGFERTLVRVGLASTRRAVIKLTLVETGPVVGAGRVAGRVGETITLRSAVGAITEISDPQKALAGVRIRRGVAAGRISGAVGNHTVFALVKAGGLPRWERFNLQVSDPVAERAAAAQRLERVPARVKWECVDLGSALNGDIRTIYQQKYLSPRPATISARIATDGYSPWTFLYWNSFPPIISLDGVPQLLDPADRAVLRTPQGVPFHWPGEASNVAFTSLWENWPATATVPVGRAGDAVWFLVCGSTNPMQGRIANAVLVMDYVRGPAETLELVPPVNYWNLSPIKPVITAPGQDSRFDYTAPADAFCVPKVWPQTVQLGDNCRAMLLGWRLRRGAVLKSVTLRTLSSEVVVGLMGVSVMNPR